MVPAAHPCGMRILGESRYDSGKVVAVEGVGFPFRRDDGTGSQLVFVGSNIDTPLGPRPDIGRIPPFHVHERDFIHTARAVPAAACPRHRRPPPNGRAAAITPTSISALGRPTASGPRTTLQHPTTT